MHIVKVTPYVDRGLLRHRIEWVDGEVSGVADSRCTLTGVSLGAHWTMCVKHCRVHGHFSEAANGKIGLYAIGVIPEAALRAFVDETNTYPDTMQERERMTIEDC